ncbi:MAG: GNAT family N-acetyltransferase [Pseudomonadota bacterium]
MQIEFALADASGDASEQIEAELLSSLRSSNPQATNASFVLSAKDADGALSAGLTASTSYGWLLIKTLWVAQALRGKGIGRALMVEAESRGRELGCHSVWLDTSSPQANAFYTQLGFEEFGLLSNGTDHLPHGHKRWFLKKAL